MANPLDDPKIQAYLAKMKDDIELDSTRCATCQSLVFLGFQHCTQCGTFNENYDSDYDVFEGEDCSAAHDDALVPSEYECQTVFCGKCGQQISPNGGLALGS